MDGLLPRDRHFFGPGKKRILSLDGGGVRGALTIAFLERLEAILAQQAGKPVRLCDWFDLIGGTSTGSIIAAALALGMSASDIRVFYEQLGPKVFKASYFRVPGWTAKFDSKRLFIELARVFGDRRLQSEDLQTGLCIVLKRIDTGGSWILLNNPKAKFWVTPPDRSYIGNAELRLASLVRASTAAPHYFDPELIEIVEGQPPGLFLDGGMTPHNNPSLALFLSVALPPYGLNWALGPDKLTIVSVGTGLFRPTLSVDEARKSYAIGLAIRALGAQVAENQRLTLLLMSWLGQTSMSWPIDSEVGDVGGITPPFGPQFGFHRLDVLLERQWIADHLGVEVDAAELRNLRHLDHAASIPRLHELGAKAAAIQLKAEEVATW